MRHKPWNIFYHELIGLRVRIVEHLNPQLVGLEGTVYLETPRSLVIRLPGGRLARIIKSEARFLFVLPSGEHVLVEGNNILGGPAERTKRLKRGRR